MPQDHRPGPGRPVLRPAVDAVSGKPAASPPAAGGLRGRLIYRPPIPRMRPAADWIGTARPERECSTPTRGYGGSPYNRLFLAASRMPGSALGSRIADARYR